MMGENINLKDLYDEEQSYTDIGTIAVPKTDGSGNTYYVQRPLINYTLQDPPTHELTDGVFALNMGDGTFLGELDRGNFAGAVSGPVDGKTTKPIASIRITTPVTGVTETPWTTTMLLYLYESLTSAVLLEILNIESTAVFTAQPGWGQMLYDKDGAVTGYAQITNPAAVTFGIQQPNDLLNASNFYALLSEVTQDTQSVDVTENGAQTIVPTAGKSGIRKVALNVNVPSSGGNLQEKSVSITSNGTTEVTPDAGYDGMSKVKAVVNVAGGGGSVQANWAQNDSTAADYVKNRPGGFYIPGMSAQTVTFDGVETGRETVDLSALGMAGFKLVKVSDLMLYPINFDGCTVKVTSGGTETQVTSFTADYLTDYGVATIITDENIMPMILSVVGGYTFGGISIGAGTWFLSAASVMYVSSLALPDTSGQMLNVNIPAKLLDIVIPKAGTETLGGVKADYAGPIPGIGDRVVLDSEGFLRYPYKAVTVNNDLTDEQKIAARKSINLYENAAFYGNFLINRDEVHSTLGNVNNADGFLNFLFGIGNIVSGMNLAPYGNAVFGAGNQVSGEYHFVFGSHLVDADSFGLVIGKYNELVSSVNKAFVIGGGDAEDNRKNVFSVDWGGNIEAGKSIILESSTAGSTKKFKIAVDDTGTLTATEVTN